MKIVDLEIQGFGVWNGLRIERLAETLNVFYGPNEAGKTTLLEFVRGVFYGWNGPRRRYLPPVRGGRGGGRLTIDSPMGSFRIERFDETPIGGPVAESLQIVDQQGARQDDHLLDTLLGEVDEPTFNHVFAFGLSELQRLDTLSDTEAAQWLFRISAGLDRVSLVDVIEQLERSRHRVLAPAPQRSHVAHLLQRRKRLLEEIRPLHGLTRKYAELTHQREEHQRRIASLDQQMDSMQQQLRLIEAALAVRVHWNQRCELNQRLASMPSVDDLPPRALARLERVTSELCRRRREFKRLSQKGRLLARRLRSFGNEPSLARHAMRIEALLEQRPWIADEQRRIDALQEEVGQLERQLGMVSSPTGQTSSAAMASDSTVPQPSRIKRLRRLARDVVSSQHRCQELEKQIEPLRRQASNIDGNIAQILREHADAPDITTAMRRCGHQVTTLRHRVQVDERIEKLTAQQRELEEQTQHLVDGQLLPSWLLSSLGGLFALGAALILLSFILPASVVGSAGWTFASLGGLGLVGAVGAKFFFEHSAARRLDAAQRQLDLVTSQLKQARQDRRELDDQLPAGAGPLLSRLSEAERAMQTLEQALPLETQRQTLATQLDDLAQQLAESEQAFFEAQQAWEQELLEQGLPEQFAPDDLRRLMRERSQHSHLRRQLDVMRQELHARRRSLETIELRVLELAEQAGIQLNGDNILQHLDNLARVLREHQAVAQKCELLRSRLQRIRRRRTRLKKRLAYLARRRRRLLRAAGVVDEAEFRRRASQQARWEELTRRRDMLSTQIATALAGQASEDALAELLNENSDEQLVKQREGMSTRIEQLRQRQRRLIDQCGQITQQMKTLTHDRRLSQKYVELDQIHQQLAESVGRWQVLLLSQHIANRVRQDYESHRQPETLKAASTFLQHLTEGRYQRVWTPVGSQTLRVDDRDGQCLPIEVLSRGAREQLFLALRLALTESYAERGIRLPLVLDDLLVNFDTQRARAAAQVLQDFAERDHQLLVFTCHEHIVALFKNLRATVRELPNLDAASRSAQVTKSSPSPPSQRKSKDSSKRRRPAASSHKKAASRPHRPATKKDEASQPLNTTAPRTDQHKPLPAAHPAIVAIADDSDRVMRWNPRDYQVFDTPGDVILVEPDETLDEPDVSQAGTDERQQTKTAPIAEEHTLRLQQPSPQHPTAHRVIEVVEEELNWSLVQNDDAEEFAGEFAERVFVSRAVEQDSDQGQSVADAWTQASEPPRGVTNKDNGAANDTTAVQEPGILSVVIDEEHRAPVVLPSRTTNEMDAPSDDRQRDDSGNNSILPVGVIAAASSSAASEPSAPQASTRRDTDVSGISTNQDRLDLGEDLPAHAASTSGNVMSDSQFEEQTEEQASEEKPLNDTPHDRLIAGATNAPADESLWQRAHHVSDEESPEQEAEADYDAVDDELDDYDDYEEDDSEAEYEYEEVDEDEDEEYEEEDDIYAEDEDSFADDDIDESDSDDLTVDDEAIDENEEAHNAQDEDEDDAAAA